jgi:hypothetical protein
MSLQPTLKITERRQRKSTRPGGLGRGEEIAVRAPPHCRSLSPLRRRQPAAMASRKLLLSLTAGRRGLQFRATSRLLSASNLQEATASRSLAAARCCHYEIVGRVSGSAAIRFEGCLFDAYEYTVRRRCAQPVLVGAKVCFSRPCSLKSFLSYCLQSRG